MKTLKKKVGMFLLMAMFVSLLTPAIPAEAAEDVYLAYQTDANGNAVNRMSSGMAEMYRVDKLLLTPGAEQDLCFINAGSWKDAKWKSSNTKVAKVDGKGNVTGVGDGEATITLTYKKKITNKTVTVKAKVCVGEKYWGLDAGISKELTVMDCLEMRVGGDLFLDIYGLPDLDNLSWVYSIDATSSNAKVAEVNGISQFRLFARKAGTAVITITVKNRLNGVTWTKKLDVKVTEPVAAVEGPQNKYFSMYGEDYINMFKQNWTIASGRIEQQISEAIRNEVHNQVDSMGWAGLIGLTDISETLKLAFNSMFKGKEYAMEEIQKSAVLHLVQEITQDTENEAYLGECQKMLKKTKEILSVTKEVGEAFDLLTSDGIEIDEDEFETLKEFFMEHEFGNVDSIASTGLTEADYLITSLYLYELDVKMLDKLQNCVSKKSSLYEDIALVKKERKKDPVKYYLTKYGSEAAQLVIGEVLVTLAGAEFKAVTDTIHKVAKLAGDIAGIADLSDSAKATRLAGYLSDLDTNARVVSTQIKNEHNTLSDTEIVELISEYELIYNTYLSLVEPVAQALSDLKTGGSRELSKAKQIVLNGYDYNRHIAMAMALYYYKNGSTNTAVNFAALSTNTNTQWSEWQDTLPSYVNNTKYQTEERTLYRYKQLETTTGTTETLSGWELYDKAAAGEKYGAWSEWNTAKPTSQTNRQTESKTQYSYRTKQKQKGYSDWSAWQAQPITQTAGTEVEARTVYGYYYYYCSNCGAHMHGYGTNACYTWAGGCGASIPASNAFSFFNESPHSTGLGDWHGTGKYYKILNGELVFKWENYSMQEYRSRTYTEGEKTVYSDWSEYSDTVYTADAGKEVRTRTVYRFRDKTTSTIYYFRRWSDWSGFSTTPMASADTIKVETKKQYRFKAK